MASPPNKDDIFSTAVYQTLLNWPVLKIAREYGFGCRNAQAKESWLFESIVQIFKDNDTVYPEDLEDFVSEVLFNEFDTIVEDGSLNTVCKSICSFYSLCKTSQSSKVLESIEEMKKFSAKSTVVKQAEAHDEEETQGSKEKTLARSTDVKESETIAEIEAEKSNESQDGLNDHETNVKNGLDPDTQPVENNEDGWEVVRRSKKRR